jgi:FkbM family methyltransferase
MRRLICSLEHIFPNNFRQLALGSPADPSRLANFVHGILNRIPGERVACLPCKGVLQGCSMKIDWACHRSYIYGVWEPEVVSALQEVVRPGCFAIDAGAHIGFFTLILSRLVGPAGRVIAFEPLPWNFSVLNYNVRINRCSNVDTVDKALLDRKCELVANLPDDQPLPVGAGFSPSGGKEPITVDAVSLDDFLHDRQSRLHLIKVDVEGSELLVLRGACRTIETYHPTMIIEVHHFDSSPDASPAVDQIRAWGYEIRWLSRRKLTSHLLAI